MVYSLARQEPKGRDDDQASCNSVVHSDNGPAFIAHVFQVAIAAFDV